MVEKPNSKCVSCMEYSSVRVTSWFTSFLSFQMFFKLISLENKCCSSSSSLVFSCFRKNKIIRGVICWFKFQNSRYCSKDALHKANTTTEMIFRVSIDHLVRAKLTQALLHTQTGRFFEPHNVFFRFLFALLRWTQGQIWARVFRVRISSWWYVWLYWLVFQHDL